MLNRLQELERNNTPIRVALVGAGAMGLGIAWQIGKTPGMCLAYVADISLKEAKAAAKASGQVIACREEPCTQPLGPDVCIYSNQPLNGLNDASIQYDALVEASNTIAWAARYCRAAISRSAHVVLMNAEVDLALGLLLHHEARQQGVQLTSDGGDQHGVLKRMMDDISLWGFKIVQAGNIKGFLNRYACADGLIEEAAKRRLNPIQCCAYTDGTKLNIEMALLANGTGLLPPATGMSGPKCQDVHEVLDLFDFDGFGEQGQVDYILGAQPGGGVYVIGHCDDPMQMQYLDYYKLGQGPYYLFYRPYHLCHLETPKVIAEVALAKKSLLNTRGLATNVFAYAKQDISLDAQIEHGIGGDLAYGLIAISAQAEIDQQVPIILLEAQGDEKVTFLKELKKDKAITWDAVSIPESYLLKYWREQKTLADALEEAL